MPRIARLIIEDEQTCYHIVSRTALDGFPLGRAEKDALFEIIKRYSNFYFMEVFGFCIMGNHFHLLLKSFPETHFSDADLKKRLKAFYGSEFEPNKKQLAFYRAKLSQLGNYMGDIKQNFSRYYNKRHKRRGTFWDERYKSVILEPGETLVTCMAYLDLNPVRAGLVKRPETYPWNSIGYHVKTANKDNFLSFDLAYKPFKIKNKEERVKRYRQFIHDAGAIGQAKKKAPPLPSPKRAKGKKGKKKIEITRADRFLNKTRHFSDSGIIGSKEFVSKNYQQFKNRFASKHEKKPTPIKGLAGIYSLKRLSEMIK